MQGLKKTLITLYYVVNSCVHAFVCLISTNEVYLIVVVDLRRGDRGYKQNVVDHFDFVQYSFEISNTVGLRSFV